MAQQETSGHTPESPAVFFHSVEVNSPVEIAYELRDSKVFGIVEELEQQSEVSMTRKKPICCIFSCFAVVGLGIGALSFLATGCLLGAASFVLFIMAGSAAGYCVFFRLARILAQSAFYVSTSGAETPSETVLGVTC